MASCGPSPSANPQVLVGELDDRHPMILLPVRIETRFQLINERNELRVRIFPDEVAIIAHRRELTQVELDRRQGILDRAR